jgi:hypothetical protein
MNEAALPSPQVESFEVTPVHPPHSNGEAVTTSVYDRIENPLDAIEKLGEIIARSGMCGCTRLEQGSLLAMHCLAEKISPLELTKRYHIINGKLAIRTDAMSANFFRLGGAIEWLEYSDTVAEANFIYKGITTKVRFDMKEAAKAGLPNKGGAWKTYPGALLRARLLSKALRMCCPQAVAGTYTADELSDTPVSPAQEKSLFTNE